jgi:hypothetical protein
MTISKQRKESMRQVKDAAAPEGKGETKLSPTYLRAVAQSGGKAKPVFFRGAMVKQK